MAMTRVRIAGLWSAVAAGVALALAVVLSLPVARATTVEAPAAAAAEPASEAEQVDAAGLYAANCARCHGRTARGAGSFPRLAGKKADYLAERLTRYRAGEKVGANTSLMAPMARDLTDAQIAALAVYIATQF
jgi:cytochrome c553